MGRETVAARETPVDPMSRTDRAPDPAPAFVVLAGGESRRMGRDKALLSVGGRPMLEGILTAGARWSGELVLVANARGRYRRALLRQGWRPWAGDPGPGDGYRRDGARLRLIPDLREGEGPVAGIEAGLRAAGTEICFVTACDRPHVSEELAHRLVRHLRSGTDAAGVARPAAALPVREGRLHPLCGAYTRAVGRAASASLAAGERSVIHGLLPRLDVLRVELDDAPGRWFLNLNTPEDLERAR